MYCSKLKGERSFFTLSRNLIGITEPEDRKTILRIMEKLGMDIGEFVLFQPKSLFQEYPNENTRTGLAKLDLFTNEPPSIKFGRRLKPDFLGEDAEEDLNPADERLIQALEWMMLVDGLWEETFSTGVAIYKRFLSTCAFSIEFLPVKPY